MKTRFVAVSLAASLAAAVFAPAAGALTHKLYVTPIISRVEPCRAATDQVIFAYAFKAKIKRSHSPNPKRVTIRYSVADLETSTYVLAEKLTLKPNRSKARNFYKVGAFAQYTAGHQLRIDVDASFKSPLTGKTIRKSSSISDGIPTVEQLDALSSPLPACAAG